MGRYTDHMEHMAYVLSPDDLPDTGDEESLRSMLLSMVRDFHTAADIIDELLISSDAVSEYKISSAADLNLYFTVKEKASLIRKLFQNAEIPVPRNLNSYLSGKKRFDRRTAYQFAFAFHLNEKDTERFFRKAWLGRVFDCHYETEAVFWHCIRKGYSYQHAMSLLSRILISPKGEIPDHKWDEHSNCFSDYDTQKNISVSSEYAEDNLIKDDADILYTGEIRNQILSFETDDEVIEFLNQHRHEFSYNNATAIRYIQSLWNQVSALISQEYDLRSTRAKQTSISFPCTIEKMIDWILGLYDPDDEVPDRISTDPAFRKNRSLKTFLRGNPLLHPFAEDSFPDRNTLQSCLSGRHVSHESVRKLLILLLFYRFLIRRAVKNVPGTHRLSYAARQDDCERCCQEINRYLSEAGYLELYYGNPYDWIFLYCMLDDEPLAAFRMFMTDLVLEKQENNE